MEFQGPEIYPEVYPEPEIIECWEPGMLPDGTFPPEIVEPECPLTIYDCPNTNFVVN